MGFMRMFARIVLLSPLVVIVVGLLCTYIPGASELLSNIFWETLGEIDAFRYASQLIQQGMGYETLSPSEFGASLFMMIAAEVMDAFVLGACVFVVKVTCMRFTRRYLAQFSQPEWVLTVVGVVIGVLLLALGGAVLEQEIRILVSGVLVILCMVYGILRMLNIGNPLRPGRGTYRSRRDGTIARLLLGILGNGITALCAVLLITCMFEGPRMIQAGGSMGVWVIWCACSIGVMYLCELFLRWVTPSAA